MRKRVKYSLILCILISFFGMSFIIQRFIIDVNGCEKDPLFSIQWDGASAQIPVEKGRVSSQFNQVDNSHQEPHNGVDIAASGNIYAVVNGVVVANTYTPTRGYLIAIAFIDSDGVYYTYMYQHMKQRSNLSIDSYVKRGDIVGVIGNSGMSFGEHLHAEVEYADMSSQQPKWKGTYPTNTNVMFDFIRFFHLSNYLIRSDQKDIRDYNSRHRYTKCRRNNEVALEGNGNEEKTWNFLIREGFTEEGAAGVIGNLLVESGLNPMAGEIGASLGGRGIAQWGQCGSASNGASAGCRWKSLESWASRHHRDANTLETQLDYLIQEMEEYKILDYFKRVKILYLPGKGYGGGAVGYFTEKFERPDFQYAHMNKRYQYAKAVIQKYGKLS